jgi:hypothetical protein
VYIRKRRMQKESEKIVFVHAREILGRRIKKDFRSREIFGRAYNIK